MSAPDEVYVVEPSDAGIGLYDIVRTAPTVVAKELRLIEANALARDLNDQINRMEHPE